MSLVGKEASDFVTSAVLPDNSIIEKFSLRERVRGKMAVLFFYPLDFTFVCPSEIIALDKKMSDFDARNTEVYAISVDSVFTHHAYKETLVDKGGIGKVKFTMLSDLTKNISRAYEVLTDDGVALRGTFIIDKLGIIRHQSTNDLPFGRNIDEILRLIDAIIFQAENPGDVCPANWRKGSASMKATQEGVVSYLQKHAGDL